MPSLECLLERQWRHGPQSVTCEADELKEMLDQMIGIGKGFGMLGDCERDVESSGMLKEMSKG